ncbi:MAG TPA: BT_3928 family protein [Bacteroidales bacterium]|nr:BT_3928 family protein [Bacteroidales bacterium]
MKTLLWFSRIIFGLVFLLSGFFKAIDPLGSTYKIQDYFLALNLDWMFGLALPLAVLISTLEIVIAISILLGLKIRYSAWGALLLMIFFTPFTLYVAIFEPVPHCGCFGDAIILPNWVTFYKNIVLLAAAIFIFSKRNDFNPLLSVRADWYVVGATALVSLMLSVYCLRNLPIIDFLPWRLGNYIPGQMQSQPEVANVYLIFENSETGQTAEFPATDYPWDDPEWTRVWQYKDQRREVISPYVPAPIENFLIRDENFIDLTAKYINNPGLQFLAVAYDLYATNTRAFANKITPLALQANSLGQSFIVLTGSSFEKIHAFRHQHQTPYPFYQVDPVALKTMIRSNPGLLLLKDGVVIGKWAHRNIPDFETLSEKHLR